jgi:predicted kinase
MDLVERDLRAAANIVFNRYLAETRRAADLDALVALPFYLSMRAAIRAKVTAARLEQTQAGERPAIARNARTYFDWARRFIAPAPPMLVAVGGLSGTGKSVLARALAADLAPAPGAVVLRSDVERKAMFGVAETAPLPADAYTPEVTGHVYAVLAEKAGRALAAGHSAVLDAVFAQPQERDLAPRAADRSGAAFRGLFLTADVATRVARVAARSRDASDADSAVARKQEAYVLGDLDWTCVDASGTPAETFERARAAIGCDTKRPDGRPMAVGEPDDQRRTER